MIQLIVLFYCYCDSFDLSFDTRQRTFVLFCYFSISCFLFLYSTSIAYAYSNKVMCLVHVVVIPKFGALFERQKNTATIMPLNKIIILFIDLFCAIQHLCCCFCCVVVVVLFVLTFELSKSSS